MVKLKQEEKALRYLLELYQKDPKTIGVLTGTFSEEFKKDSAVLADLLVADGYAEIKTSGEQVDARTYKTYHYLALTAKGRTYFLKKEKEQMISRKQFFQSAAIAVISAVVSTLLTLLVSQRSDGSGTSSS